MLNMAQEQWKISSLVEYAARFTTFMIQDIQQKF